MSHGQTRFNQLKKIQRSGDSPLTSILGLPKHSSPRIISYKIVFALIPPTASIHVQMI